MKLEKTKVLKDTNNNMHRHGGFLKRCLKRELRRRTGQSRRERQTENGYAIYKKAKSCDMEE